MFEGMFAIAVIDWTSRQIILARDRFGIKPLLYSQHANAFAFSSDLRALRLLSPDFPKLEHSAIPEYLLNQAILAPRTIYRNVYKVEPGQCVEVSIDRPARVVTRHWTSVVACSVKSLQSIDWVSSIESAIIQSLGDQICSTEESALLVSGGLDSALIAAISTRHHCLTNRTAFCVSFPGTAINEDLNARQISSSLGIDLLIKNVYDSDVYAMEDLCDITGEPFGDDSLLPTFLLASKVSDQGIRLAFSGDGADELFAGYDLFVRWLAACDSGNSDLSQWGTVTQKYFSLNEVLGIVPPNWHAYVNHPSLVEATTFESLHTLDSLAVGRIVRLRHTLPDVMLRKVDSTFMAFGIEVRIPFLSNELLNLALQCPRDMLISSSDAPDSGKHVLREIWKRYFATPNSPRKIGFNCPLASWAEIKNGEFRNRIHQLRASEVLRDVFRNNAISDMVDRLLLQKRFKALWILMMLDLWLRKGNFA
jgi:asparagine synthase (glutamine-hydrolysing)